MAARHVRELNLRSIARHAAPSLIDGTVIPLVLFTGLVHTWGLRAALWSSLGWAYGAIARRVVLGRRVPGVVLIGAVGVTVRMATMVWTGSAWLFFFQPVLATVATGAAFAVSAVLRRPLAARLGADFVPLAPQAWADPEVQRLTTQLSLLWAVALTANAGLTLWLLSTFSVPTFVLLRPIVSITTTLPAIVASILAAKVVLRRSGARLHPMPVAEPADSALDGRAGLHLVTEIPAYA